MKKASVALVAAVSLLTAATVLLVSVFYGAGRLQADFIPLDRSTIGPNLLASAIQAIIVFAVAAVLYPPLRRWAEKELEHVHAKVDHQIDLMHHIIEHHPDIPNDDPLGRLWRNRRPERGRPR